MSNSKENLVHILKPGYYIKYCNRIIKILILILRILYDIIKIIRGIIKIMQVINKTLQSTIISCRIL